MKKELISFNVPTIFTVFGITGDLSQKKLIPALLDLFIKGYLPDVFEIVGFSRSTYSHDQFRNFAHEVIDRKNHGHPIKKIEEFLERVTYVSGDFSTPQDYKKLADHLVHLDQKIGQCTNKLFHLAVPPVFYEKIFRELAHSGLTIPCSNETGWTRVLVEKPFGKDLKTAQDLDILLAKLFKEEQIFRIDHYLGKNTLQNILSFRFSNIIFEPIWNKDYIEKVDIVLSEMHDVAQRGSFYDGIGALRDVGQNHILQMLALIVMENPHVFTADAIRRERAKALSFLHINSKEDLYPLVVRGQYEGYLFEDGVEEASQTETYFKIKAFVDADRWRGVPFSLESGKALDKNLVSITIHFKEPTPCLCPPYTTEHVNGNVVTFMIQPEEKISVRFLARRPGLEKMIESHDLSFDYSAVHGDIVQPDAYEKILFDCIRGDQTLFTSTHEVQSAWRFITPIIENWDSLPLHIYAKGSGGPNK